MKRYFIDCVSEVAISEDKSVISLTCGNFDKEGNAQPDFDIVMPKAAFLKLSSFFDGLNEKLGLGNNNNSESEITTDEVVNKLPKTTKTSPKVNRKSKKA